MAIEPLTSDDPGEIAGYRLRARLGAGGMGRVYLAFTPGGRPVALKVVRPDLGDDQDFRNRFRQEIQAAQRVHGLYTAQLLDADPEARPPWLVAAYVPGPSLQQAIADHGPMPVETVLLLMAGVAEALQAIHSVGVVHRDLKPSNVLLAPDGPRVIDFGIARAAEATALTRSGARVGSPPFMAPEQVRGLPVSPAIDVFALGSLAAYAISGRSPFGDGNEAAVLYRVVHEAPDLGGCPAQLRPLVEGCLTKEPSGRPGPAEIIEFCRARTAGGTVEFAQAWLPPAVAAAVARYATPTKVQTLAAGSPPRRGRWPLSHARLIGALAAAVVLVALISTGVLALIPTGGGPRQAAGDLPHRTRGPSQAATAGTAAGATTPGPDPAGTPVAAASPPSAWFSGAWVGTASQPAGVVTHWTIELTFPATGTTGTFLSSTLGCSGTLIVTKSSSATASAYEEVTSNPRGLCVPGGLVTLTRHGPHLMDMVWQDAANQDNLGSGQLTGRTADPAASRPLGS